MDRSSFETLCSEQNTDAAVRRETARQSGAACNITPMLAFGGIDYCTTHGVMGRCPFGGGK